MMLLSAAVALEVKLPMVIVQQQAVLDFAIDLMILGARELFTGN
jgi:hypothetical protein